MCDEDITCFKQRFKGIENFLRRVAFNLGNTASQTEVKIISCIPIDVTDLQQKIVNLEKELQGYKECKQNVSSEQKVCKREKTSEKTTAFNASITETCLKRPEICNSKIELTKANKPISSNICPLQDSNVSFVFSALSLGSCAKHTKTIEDTHCTKQSTQKSKRGNIFRRKRNKSCTDKNNQKTHFVYYAKEMKTPFFGENFQQQEKPHKTKDIFSTHLSNIMRKQYNPKFGLDEFSDTSQFSKPVCKDSNSPIQYDSDVCSCCYGRFQNVDNYMGSGVDFLIDQNRSYISSKDINKTYYDSKFYDVIPVKDMSGSLKEKHKKEVTKTYNGKDTNRPEAVRSKHCINPITLNYRAEIYHSRRCHQTRQKPNIDEKISSHSKRHKHLQKDNQIHGDTSKSFSVNCGSIYTKRMPLPKLTIRHDKAILNQRENRLTVFTNSKDNLGKTSKSIQLEVDLLNETRTETMLNQIKNILQSVLTEVKTNTQLGKEETQKRDAIVQKGPSENSVPACSKVCNNFTYPASNVAPSYYTPYSQAYVPFSHLRFDNFPFQQVKCVQNSPYFMESCQGRCKCFCQYKNNSFSKFKAPAPVIAATNTSDNNVATTETNNLIKEIYKSVALNLNDPAKYSSTNYDIAKPDNIKFKKSETDVRSIYDSEIMKSDKEIEALLSICTDTCSQSEEKETKETITENIRAESHRIVRANKQLYHLYRLEEKNNRRNNKIRRQEKDDTCSKAESDSTVMPQSVNEKNKKGFFSRIVEFLKRRKACRHDTKVEENSESSENNDTDDYETVYSGSTTQSQSNYPPHQRQGYTKKSPRINIQVNGTRIGRFPYTEQEYQRRNNDLVFGKKEKNDIPHRPGTSRSVRCQQKYTPYRKHYEARSVIIDDREGGCHFDHWRNNANMKEKNGFLKKHKLGLRCGEQWKTLILDN